MTETTAEKAQRLVDEGRVNIVMHWKAGIEAEVQGEQKLYDVFLFANGAVWCNCLWRALHPNPNRLCAHTLAVKLVAGEAT